MKEKSTTDKATLLALETLSRSAVPREREAPPVPPTPVPTPPKAEPPPTSPPPKDVIAKPPSKYRCLACGYPLLEQTSYRCSECGRKHEARLLEQWFSGTERDRLDRILGLVRAGVLLRLMLIPHLLTLVGDKAPTIAWIGGTVAAGWACFVASRRRLSEPAGTYAIIGGHLSALIVAISLWQFLPGNWLFMTDWSDTVLWLDALLAGTLFAAIARPTHDVEMPGARLWLRVVGGVLVVATLLTLLSASELNPLRIGSLSVSPAIEIVMRFMPFVLTMGVWGIVWWRIASIRSALYPPIRRAKATDEVRTPKPETRSPKPERRTPK